MTTALVPLGRKRRRVARWRVAVLVGVHLAIAAHFAHFLVAGRTLAPLELNEVLYTIHAGVITAGFVFMGLAIAGTFLFGRFFCGWGCHMLALQDLAAWALAKVGWKAKPLRSRALAAVAPLAAIHLFLWPEIDRWLAGRPRPAWVIDAEGWSSFTTDDFARNLPSVGIAILTFAICAFAMVAALGSRAFCRIACPYGAIFRAMDRIAPARIVLAGDCIDCGACTAVCPSHIEVHREVRTYGRLVDPHCLKDMECVSVCPTQGLRYQRSAPAWTAPRIAPASELALGDEALAAIVLLVVVLAWRGLYDAIPFLLALGIGGLAAWAALLLARMARERDVSIARLVLRSEGRTTAAGLGLGAAAIVFAALTAHGAVVRAHAYLGERAMARAQEGDPAALEEARSHLERAERWGLVVPIELERRLASIALAQGDLDEAITRADRILLADPDDDGARARLARALYDRGERDRAELEARRALEAPDPAARAIALEVIADAILASGDRAGAIARLEQAVALDPTRVATARRLASLSARTGELDRALALLEDAARRAPRSARIRDELGVVLGLAGRPDEAIAAHRAAIELDPRDAIARTNLGVQLANRGLLALARAELEQALEIDPLDTAARDALAAIGGTDHAR